MKYWWHHGLVFSRFKNLIVSLHSITRDDNIKKYIVQSKKEAPSFIDKGRACVIETLTLP